MVVEFVILGVISLIVGGLGTWFFIRKKTEEIEQELMERFIAGIKDGTFDVVPYVPRAFIKFSRIPKPTVQDIIDDLTHDEEWKDRAKSIVEHPNSFGLSIENIGTFDPSVYTYAERDLFRAYDAHEVKYGRRSWRVPDPNDDTDGPFLRALTPKERELGKVYE